MSQTSAVTAVAPAGAIPHRSEPTRIIEIGDVVAGIAVPEGGRVRFFSSARDFDSLDGTIFSSTEKAARAARERVRAAPGAGSRAAR